MNLAPTISDTSERPSERPSGIRLRPDGGDDARGSEAAAFGAFAAAQYDRVRAWARVLNVTRFDAEDIAQDALVCLWLRRADVHEAGWPGWLRNAIVLRARMHFRSRRRAQRHEFDFALDLQGEANRVSAEADLYARECERELRSLIDGLRPERRAVVRRYLLDEVPMAEVAAELRIGEETAQKRWRLAQADMRAAFGRDRARERFKAAIAAFLSFVAVFWARLDGDARAATLDNGRGGVPRSRGALAGAAGRRSHRLVLAAVLGLWVLGVSLVSHAPLRLPDLVSSLDNVTVRADPLLPSMGVFLPGWAERERAQTAPLASLPPEAGTPLRPRSKLPRVLLTQASAALRDGRIAAARSLLAAYRMAYPVDPTDPFYPQYKALAGTLGAN